MTEKESAIIPDIEQISLESFGTLPNSEQKVADIITLSDFSKLIDLRDMTLGLSIQNLSRDELLELSLEDYPFVAEITLAEIAQLTNTYKVAVKDLPLVQVALETFLSNPSLAVEKKLTLAQVVGKYPDIGSIKLGFLELDQYDYKAIPGLLEIPLTQIPNWEQVKVSEIPGLERTVIDGGNQLDGSIVQLNTVRDAGRVKIRLEDESGLGLDWSEDPKEGLSPFDSYLTVANIYGEKVRISAYFQSCLGEGLECSFLGPFAVQEYSKGDGVYVSAKDWSLASREDFSTEMQTTTGEEAVLPYTGAENFSGERRFIRIAIIAAVGFCSSGAFLLYLLLSGLNRKRKRS